MMGGGLPLTLPAFGLSILVAILLCVHVVRTHRDTFWLWIILLFQPLGGLVYFFAIIVPELFRGPAARKLGQAARETLDPARDYREAKAAHELTPSVHNQMRLAAAATELGRPAEAEALYRAALQGVHADDPALLLGLARALIELNRPAEALPLFDKLSAEGGEHWRTPPAVLALARAYDGVGRVQDADTAYGWAAGRFPGLEGIARRAAFLARQGRKAEAEHLLAEIDRRIARANKVFRKEGRAWRDFAAAAIAKA